MKEHHTRRSTARIRGICDSSRLIRVHLAWALGLEVALFAYGSDALAEEVASAATPAVDGETGVLHVYGPEGSGRERRALAVVERAGRCVSWDDVSIAVEQQDAEVSLEDPAGPCARWIRIATRAAQSAVTIVVRGDGWSAASAVSMGEDRGLGVTASRAGARIRVRVRNVPAGEPVRVVAYWPEGQEELSRRGHGPFTGTVPSDALVGVVARSGTLVGAAVIARPISRYDSPAALVMPSELSIPAGGAPRTAAFLVVSDRRGRLSRTVPLSVTSERGTLRRMRWVERGLAAIELSAEPGTARVDLAVSARREGLAEAELSVSAGYPVAAVLEGPPRVELGATASFSVSATAASGDAVEGTRLRVVCGDLELEPDEGGGVECAPASAGERGVSAAALIDGRLVPLASTSLEVVEPEPDPEPEPEPVPEGPPPSRVAVWLGGLVGGGIDTWGRGNVTVGARLELRFWELTWVRLSLSARYSTTMVAAKAVPGDVPLEVQEIEGIQHGADLLVGGVVDIPVGPVRLVGRVVLGPAYSFSDITTTWLDEGATSPTSSQDGAGGDVRFLLGGAVGLRVPVGAVDLFAEIGALGNLAESEVSWGAAPVGFFLELGVGAGLLE